MDPMELIKAAVTSVDTSKAQKFAGIKPETEIRELGLDSVATMEMVAYLEDHLHTQFADEVLVKINTFKDLVQLIESAQKK